MRLRASSRLSSRSHRYGRRSSAALLLLIVLFELSAVLLPVVARVPARAAAAITVTRLRAAPEPSAEPLLRLPEGATVTVHGPAKNGWYRARRGRLEGYVLSGDVATAPIPMDGDAQPGEAIDEPLVVEQAQRARGRDRNDRGGRKRERRQARESDDAMPLSGEIFTADDLNLRAAPSRDAPVVVTMPRGALVEPTGEHRNGFVELRWDGSVGWALGKHLAASRPVRTARGRDPSSWSQREIIEIIYAAADRYGQPREDMLRVARCESDLVPTAVNGPGGSYGLFQFKPDTWLSTPFAEFDIFDPRASANAAAWMWSVGRRREWVCQ